MAIRDDFDQSKLKEEDYIKVLWRETAVPWTDFEGIDIDDADEVREVVMKFVDACDGTDARKQLYRKFLAKYVDSGEFSALLDYLDLIFSGTDKDKQEMLASVFTRVLRGGAVGSHALPMTCRERLTVNPWRNALERLEQAEINL